MRHSAALPFTLRRGHDVVGLTEITSTKETIHGLLYLDGDRLIVQWRTARSTDRVGSEIRTDRELGPVREIVIPLDDVASAGVRRLWFRWPPSSYIVITAADLRAFEEIAGDGGLRMDHPAELVLQIRRADRLAAREFAGELELAVAELALVRAGATSPDRLEAGADATMPARQRPREEQPIGRHPHSTEGL